MSILPKLIHDFPDVKVGFAGRVSARLANTANISTKVPLYFFIFSKLFYLQSPLFCFNRAVFAIFSPTRILNETIRKTEIKIFLFFFLFFFLPLLELLLFNNKIRF